MQRDFTSDVSQPTSATAQRSREPANPGATGVGAAMRPERSEPASGVVEKAKETVVRVANQAGDKVKTRLDSQKDRVAEDLSGLAQALRQTTEQLQEKDRQALVPRSLRSTAEQVERVSNYMRSTDVSQMINQVEAFARREPAIFIGGAFLLGLLGARFFKSSGHVSSTQLNSESPRSSDFALQRSSDLRPGATNLRGGPDRQLGGP